MSYRALAARSGVSEPTIKRVLGGRMEEAAFGNVMAIARGLGIFVMSKETESERAMKKAAARRKAVALAGLVQGTSGLEAQALDARGVEAMVEQIEDELLAGPARRLWE